MLNKMVMPNISKIMTVKREDMKHKLLTQIVWKSGSIHLTLLFFASVPPPELNSGGEGTLLPTYLEVEGLGLGPKQCCFDTTP